ncbi:MAG: glycine zipper domain-containing protein [Pelagimonas sp.]|jgi:peptidoglycan/LPS O-acetylase OafA/YrhL|nr:glycine zipper domain-containing protein [Pelagimonas sp.]
MTKARNSAVLALVGAMFVSACAAPGTVPTQQQKTAQTAAAGAVVGAAAGALLGGNDKGERNRSMVAGALLGGAAGAAAGQMSQ